MRRFRILEITLLLVALLLAGFVWLTYHPDSELLRQAAELPVLGPVATALQRIYLPPPEDPNESPGISGGGELQLPSNSPGEPGRTAPAEQATRNLVEIDWSAIQAYPREWFVTGTTVHESPDPTSKILFTLDNPAPFALRERREEWARIQPAGREGWIQVNASTVHSSPPQGSAPIPVTAIGGRAPDEQRLTRALDVLGADYRHLRLGPYDLFTDLPEGTPLLPYLDRAAHRHEEGYGKRYGLPLQGQPEAAVVLFTKASDYRSFQADEERLSGLRASGHAGYGIVALFAEGSSQEELLGTLLHELSHLANRRAVGPALPPWLDEGLAEDFAGLTVGPDGSVREGTWRGQRSSSVGSLRWTGTIVDLKRIEDRRAQGTLMSLPELLNLPWEAFVRVREPRLRYAHSALWIRFLLRPEGELATPFREFLRAVATGEQPTPESLRSHLDRDWESLERDFRAWIQEEASTRV